MDMTATEVQQFIDALEQIESSQQYDAMISLFTEDCKVGNVLVPDHFDGKEGASRFWHDYRSSFGEIRSEFHNRVESENQAALEWIAQGTANHGQPVRYQGITVLTFNGDKIKRFMSYFDPRALGRQIEVSAEEALQQA
jgi:steroid delta-isomerase-like uncharacterized protein